MEPYPLVWCLPVGFALFLAWRAWRAFCFFSAIEHVCYRFGTLQGPHGMAQGLLYADHDPIWCVVLLFWVPEYSAFLRYPNQLNAVLDFMQQYGAVKRAQAQPRPRFGRSTTVPPPPRLPVTPLPHDPTDTPTNNRD